MQITKPTSLFCKSKKKLVKRWILFLAILFAFFSATYFFSKNNVSYLEYLYHELFDADLLFILVFVFLIDLYEKNCVFYDEKSFQIKRGLKASIQTYTFRDIAQINYLPLLQTYIIRMKRTDTYFIFNPLFYSSESFDQFKNILQSHLPIQRGYYMPMGLLIAFLVAIILISAILFSISIGYIIK
jgi:hypothetical protein